MSEYRRVDDGQRRGPPPNRRGAGGRQDDYGTSRRPPPSKGKGEAQQEQRFQQIDITDMKIEEDLQNEKLTAAVEIREGLQDVKDCYDEFGKLVQHQQTGLDNVQANVGGATTNMQKGQEQLRSAQTEQKRSRKCMCVLIGIFVAVLAAIVIVVVVVTKK